MFIGRKSCQFWFNANDGHSWRGLQLPSTCYLGVRGLDLRKRQLGELGSWLKTLENLPEDVDRNRVLASYGRKRRSALAVRMQEASWLVSVNCTSWEMLIVLI